MILAGYVRKDVFLHRTDPRAKLVLVFCILLLSFAVYDFAYLLLLLLLVSALLLLGRVEGGSLRRTLKFVAPLLIFLLAVQSVCYEYAYLVVYRVPLRVPLIGGATLLSFDGLIVGLQVALRFLIVVLALTFFTATTDPDKFLTGLTSLGVPFEVALAVNIALRFVPQVSKDVEDTVLALESRGVKLGSKNPIRKITSLGTVLFPLIVHYVCRAQELALAMEARAFGAHDKRTHLTQIKMRKADYALAIVSLVLTSLTMYLILTNPHLMNPSQPFLIDVWNNIKPILDNLWWTHYRY